MRLDRVTAEIRPRSDWEAVDLGLALVRRDFWRCLGVWWLAMLVPGAVAGWWLRDSPLLWLLVFWWMKPVASRMVLFVLSRRLFGERPAWGATLREIPRAWVRRFGYRMLWARLSPWLPVVLAVEDLEGLRGKDYKLRCGQVTRRGEGAILWIYFVADLAACWFGFAILMLVILFIPEGQDGAWQMAWEAWDPNAPGELPLLISRTVVGCMALAMSLTDLFVTGAGFGVYLNNRTWIEGWDVELAFKRLARRLTKAVMLWMVLGTILMPAVSRAAAEHDPVLESEAAQVIREVKADPVFKVHKVIDKVPVERKSWFSLDWLRWLSPGAWLGHLIFWSVVVVVVGLTGWVMWKNRHVFMMRRIVREKPVIAAKARVVMGMDVSPEALPADVPGVAWELWQQGRHQAALGLLYRGAICRVIEVAHVEILESDTEGDCVRRVDQAGVDGHPEHFRGITGAWMRLAYAGHCPEDSEVERLCRQWPFVRKGGG